MIFDSLDNLALYAGVHNGLADVQTFISTTDLTTLPTGIHPVNDHGAYASVSEYDTKSEIESFIECHKKYIDLQMIAWGEEKIGVTHVELCVKQPYDEAKDLRKLTGRVDFITLLPGFFAIFFPHDAHEPGLKIGDEPVCVKKIVFKIPA